MIKTLNFILIFFAFFVFLFAGKTLFAQESRGFSIKNLKVSPGFNSFISVEGAKVPKGFNFIAKSFFNYQYRPLVIKECNEVSGNECTSWSDSKQVIIKHRLTGDLTGAVTLFDMFEAGLVLPFVLYQNVKEVEGADLGDQNVGPAGFEDIRLHLKLDIYQGLFGQDGGEYDFSLAVIPVITFPVGNAVQEDSFMGDSFLTFHPKIAAGFKSGKFRFGLNIGYNLIKEKETYLAKVGQALTYGAAAEMTIKGKFSAMAEFFGYQALKKELASAPLEMLLAGRYKFFTSFDILGGVGVGIIPGLGTSPVRFFMLLSWSPEITAKKEKPTLKEDVLPDRDGDRIYDSVDKCPDTKEDYDNFEDTDGCPEPDNDEDGILDGYDSCRNEPEDIDGYLDSDGCPEPDNDMDSVLDENDKCPNKKEVINGVKDNDGCPDKGDELLQLNEEKIVQLVPVRFKNRKPDITGRSSKKILNAVSDLLKRNPSIRLRIEGHTDSSGSHKRKYKISKKRAEAIVKFLVKKGIDETRFRLKGHGPDKPAYDNTTRNGRKQNNRVEFYILKNKEFDNKKSIKKGTK